MLQKTIKKRLRRLELLRHKELLAENEIADVLKEVVDFENMGIDDETYAISNNAEGDYKGNGVYELRGYGSKTVFVQIDGTRQYFSFVLFRGI